MVKLKIKNFGPIGKGYEENDGYLEFSDIVLIIGAQGSGKSTVAKVYSSLSWLEKAFLTWKKRKLDFSREEFQELLKFHNIDFYLTKETYIHYIGKYYEICYEGERCRIIDGGEKKFKYKYYPRVQYIPAERNFTSVLNDLEFVGVFPDNLHDFYIQYERAKKSWSKKSYPLPINDTEVYYKESSGEVFLKGEAGNGSFDIPLGHSSSGFQTLAPMLLVIDDLCRIEKVPSTLGQIMNLAKDLEKKKGLSTELLERLSISADEKKILDSEKDPSQKGLEFYQKLFQKMEYRFIIEEPEQNLYPTSQHNMLSSLLKYYSKFERSNFVLTSHSPYLVNFFILAAKANQLYVSKKFKKLSEVNKHNLKKILPLESTVPIEELRIYQLNEKGGSISKLENYNNLPSNENLLNQKLGNFNDTFSELLDIEYSE